MAHCMARATMLTDISSSSVVSSILSMRMHVGSAVLVQAGLITQPTVFAHLTVQPSSPCWD
jgi:hypothetical protein